MPAQAATAQAATAQAATAQAATAQAAAAQAATAQAATAQAAAAQAATAQAATAQAPIPAGASRCLHSLSFCCAFLSLSLISFDIFPYRLIGGFHPRLEYMISLLGLVSYLFSFRWKRELWRHRTLLAFAGAFLLYGLIATTCTSSLLHERNFALFSLLNYLERQMGAVGFMLWFAFLLSSLPKDEARKFFIAGLMVMFCSNAAHMLLELLANHGADGVKRFLIAVNPWFRLENVYWGNWPPPYYEGRVRGLFGEPAHLAYALTPVLAFFLYKLQKQALYALLLLFVLVSYGGVLPTGTGGLGLGFLILAASLHFCRRKAVAGAPALIAVCVLASVIAVGAALHSVQGRLPGYAAEWRSINSIADYCRQAQANPDLPTPKLELEQVSRFFFRAVSTRLEWDIAARHFFGVGYQLSGLYRKPLAAFADDKAANLLRVRFALSKDEPVPVFPYFCEYTAVAAELGLPGLALFLALCLYVGLRARRRYALTKDSFILYMLFALPAFMLIFLSFALRSGVMFYYFLGFLYALGQGEDDARA